MTREISWILYYCKSNVAGQKLIILNAEQGVKDNLQ